MREVKLPSGAILKVGLAPFTDSKALYQAILEEVKLMKLDPNAEIDVNFFKDFFCVGFSSKKIEACLAQCLARCTYNDLKIDLNTTFETLSAREDYLQVCFEVAKDNIQPFTKSLYAQYGHVLKTIIKIQS